MVDPQARERLAALIAKFRDDTPQALVDAMTLDHVTIVDRLHYDDELVLHIVGALRTVDYMRKAALRPPRPVSPDDMVPDYVPIGKGATVMVFVPRSQMK